MEETRKRQEGYLRFIYGEDQARDIQERLEKLLEGWKAQIREPEGVPRGSLPVDEQDAVVITYGDSLRREGEAPLAVLTEFLAQRAADVLTGVHILPFSPYSSDDGFSVMDYRAVNPELGEWSDIERLGRTYRLMFDLVLNHCSAEGPWFQAFQRGEAPYRDYFLTADPSQDLSGVFRPRPHPLLHAFETAEGTRHVWTTFSRDQVELDFSNPDVFLEFADILLMYAARGAHIIRLDAIAYLWKELGTPCLHHPKTHAMVKLFRAVLEEAAPWVLILTETNVPHRENMSYLGRGDDEAHMIYQFSLPPLVLDAFLRGDASHLTEWAGELPVPEGPATYFNFLASHDGVGVLPARGYLKDAEVESMIDQVKARGGRVSYKATPEGEVPYELNINYRDAVAEESLPEKLRTRKFLASQAVMLSLAGVPGIYIHSLLGSGNWQAGVEQTGRNRTINREKLDEPAVSRDLEGEDTLRGRIFYGYRRLLKARRSSPAFHPRAAQRILSRDPKVFAVLRGGGADVPETVLCLHNVTGEKTSLSLPLGDLGGEGWTGFTDLITGRRAGKVVQNREKNQYIRDFELAITPADKGFAVFYLEPWEVLWLQPDRGDS